MEADLIEMADRWVWILPSLAVVRSPKFTLSISREHPGDAVVHSSCTDDGPALVEHVERIVVREGGRALKWWVLATSRPRSMHDVLARRGYVPCEIVEVLAWPLGEAAAARLPWPDLALAGVGRPESASDAIGAVTVMAEVFSGQAPSPGEIEQALQDWRQDPSGPRGTMSPGARRGRWWGRRS